jgi:hypothetical protein
MDKNKSTKKIVAVVVLAAVIAIFCMVESRDGTEADFGSKKDQKGHPEISANQSLWETYLSSTSRGAYQKAKDYLASFFEKKSPDSVSPSPYVLHENISTTFFWAGEKGSEDNHDISNSPSCWDDKWATHFGGMDNPTKRNGFLPAGFQPKENSFYFALPFNDFNSKGSRKIGLDAYIPWFNEKKWTDKESACKNQWIKIIKGDKVAYAQWEDAGPFGENDIGYVFGSDQPKSKTNDHAGLDVSPAVHDFLGLSDIDKTSWQFVDAKNVPDGPWKNTITSSGIYWK